ncbi:MAG TPA: STAS domain-containing protein [Euzebyales bacterium]
MTDTTVPSSPTPVDTRRPTRGLLVIAMPPEVTSRSEAAMTAAFERASDGDIDTVGLDFTGLDYMNSGGIGLLVTLLVRANRQRQRLVAFGLDRHYRQIFALTRLDEAIELYDDETAALAATGSRR